MRHEIRKISKMSDELTTFFLEQQAQHLNIEIKYLSTETMIAVTAKPIKNIDKVIEQLQCSLSTPRQNEIEEYYWELAGESDKSNELCLVGSMADVASLDYDEILQEIKIEITRYKHV